MDKLRRQTVKMPTSEMGGNINMKQVFAPLETPLIINEIPPPC